MASPESRKTGRGAHHQSSLGAEPSITSLIRARVPRVVAAGKSLIAKNAHSAISRLGFGAPSCRKFRTR
jgi:hypothetical protein